MYGSITARPHAHTPAPALIDTKAAAHQLYYFINTVLDILSVKTILDLDLPLKRTVGNTVFLFAKV